MSSLPGYVRFWLPDDSDTERRVAHSGHAQFLAWADKFCVCILASYRGTGPAIRT